MQGIGDDRPLTALYLERRPQHQHGAPAKRPPITSGGYQELREAMPGISLVQVIHITGREAVEEALAVAPYVDGLLLDTGSRLLPAKVLGGTGRTHDWSISRAIREAVDAPVFLAGGLNPENVAAAIHQVCPFGVDICTGVRTGGSLDEAKLAEFFAQIEVC
jgi:phosphoribosylanthranilate isomerase